MSSEAPEPIAPPNGSRVGGFVRRVAVDLTPLRVSKPFRRLWLGLLFWGFGYQFTLVAILIQVTRLTHSPVAVGMTGLVGFVALVVGTLVGAMFVDAYDRRSTLIAAQLTYMVSVGILLAGGAPRPSADLGHLRRGGPARRRVGDQLAGARRDDAEADRRRAAPLGRGAEPGRLQRHGARRPRGRGARDRAVRSLVGVRRRPRERARDAVGGGPAPAHAARARRGRRHRVGGGPRGLRLPAGTPGPAVDVRDRHHRDGVRAPASPVRVPRRLAVPPRRGDRRVPARGAGPGRPRRGADDGLGPATCATRDWR